MSKSTLQHSVVLTILLLKCNGFANYWLTDSTAQGKHKVISRQNKPCQKMPNTQTVKYIPVQKKITQ